MRGGGEDSKGGWGGGSERDGGSVGGRGSEDRSEKGSGAKDGSEPVAAVDDEGLRREGSAEIPSSGMDSDHLAGGEAEEGSITLLSFSTR